jgi:hypothetical protein
METSAVAFQKRASIQLLSCCATISCVAEGLWVRKMPPKFRLRTTAMLLCLLVFGVLLFLVAPQAPPAVVSAATMPAAQPVQNAPAAVDTSEAAAAPPTASAPSIPVVPAGMFLHVAQKGQSLPGLVHTYLPKTKYMTGSELEAAIRQANHELKSIWLKPGQNILIPGYEAEVREHPIPVPSDFEVRAIYLTGTMAGSAKGLELIREWRRQGGNSVVFDVKDSDGPVNVPFDHQLLHTEAKFKPESPLAGRATPPIRNLPKFVRFLHQQNMHAIARIAIFRDEYLVTHHPELAVRSRRTGGPWRENGKLVWADPSQPEVQQYNIALAKYAAESGVDEIQFDYVRFPAEGDQKDAQFAFEKAHPQWQRADVIEEFLADAYKQLKPLHVLFSLDVFGVMAWQRPIDLSHTGQDIVRMAKHCDVLSPMIYPSHFFTMDGYKNPGDAPEHFIGTSMERFRLITKETGVVLRPWLQAFAWRTKTYSPEYIVTQVDVAKQKGGIGFLFWNARNDYSKPLSAMPGMRAKPGHFFRGDELQDVASRRIAESEKRKLTSTGGTQRGSVTHPDEGAPPKA